MFKITHVIVCIVSVFFWGCADRSVSARARYYCHMGAGYESEREISGITIFCDKPIPLIVGVRRNMEIISFRINKLNLDSDQPIAVYIPDEIHLDGTVSESSLVGYCFIWPKQRRLYLNASIIKRIRLRLAPETEIFPDGIESHPLNGWYDFTTDPN